MTVNKKFLTDGFENFKHYKRVNVSVHPNEVSFVGARRIIDGEKWSCVPRSILSNEFGTHYDNSDGTLRVAEKLNSGIGGVDIYVFGQTTESVEAFAERASNLDPRKR